MQWLIVEAIVFLPLSPSLIVFLPPHPFFNFNTVTLSQIFKFKKIKELEPDDKKT
jgi:hypothetical protein